HYTWWSQMGNCRARNIGWRVDYFVAAERLRPALKRAWILPEGMGSDHCPVGLERRATHRVAVGRGRSLDRFLRNAIAQPELGDLAKLADGGGLLPVEIVAH